MALAHHRGRASRGGGAGQRGPPIAILAPIVAPKKPSVCRGKAAGSGGPCPLGAAMDSSALPQTGEVLPERGHGLRSPIEASASQGSKMAMMAPVAVPRKVSICRGKGLGVHDPRPLGAWMDSSASRERSTATTGCRGDYGLRRIASSARSEEVAGR
jgi:hypothetical protein